MLLGHVIDLDVHGGPAAEERLAIQDAKRLDIDADDLLGLQGLADFKVIVHSLFIDKLGDLLLIDDMDVLDVGLQAFADSFGQGTVTPELLNSSDVSGLQTTATFFPFRPSHSGGMS